MNQKIVYMKKIVQMKYFKWTYKSENERKNSLNDPKICWRNSSKTNEHMNTNKP